MNKFSGHIIEIKSSGSLSLVSIGLEKNEVLHAIIVDTPETADYLKTNTEIEAKFKETEVILSKTSDPSISLKNRIEGRISRIEKGDLLSRLVLDTAQGDLVAVISNNELQDLDLFVGQNVFAFIKSNEISISV